MEILSSHYIVLCKDLTPFRYLGYVNLEQNIQFFRDVPQK
jgi:hypothetical protein